MELHFTRSRIQSIQHILNGLHVEYIQYSIFFLLEDCKLCGNALTLCSSDETWRSANEHEKPNMWKSLKMTWELWNKIHGDTKKKIQLTVTWNIFHNHFFDWVFCFLHWKFLNSVLYSTYSIAANVEAFKMAVRSYKNLFLSEE